MRVRAAGVGEGACGKALASNLDESIRAALAARRLLVGLKGVLASANRGAHDGAAFGVQLAVENIDTVQRLADVEIPAVVVLVVGGERAIGVLAVADGA